MSNIAYQGKNTFLFVLIILLV